MVITNTRHHPRLFAALLAVVLSVLFAAPQAYAARSICRSDPIVTLSNGGVLTMWADSESDPGNIRSVDYYLHVPRGLRVRDVVHPDPTTADPENF